MEKKVIKKMMINSRFSLVSVQNLCGILLSLILFILLSLPDKLSAQEKIVPLQYNPVLKARALISPYHPEKNIPKRGPDSAFKPFPLDKNVFFDDFSTSVYTTNKTYWLDDYAFVNDDMGINPPSIGVATFDGLNQYGEPYRRGASTSTGEIADHLTSVPIDLSKLRLSDSIFLSFSFQPLGLGEIFPGGTIEPEDSLCLEFKPKRLWIGTTWDSNAWVRVWSTPGTGLKPFKQVIIPVKPFLRNPGQVPDTIASFYYDSFQFRFLNYANLSGNLNQWQVDYVYLAKGRNSHDTSFNEIALVNPPVSIVPGYMSVPWPHLAYSLARKDTLMVDSTPLFARYLGNNFLNLRSGFEISNAKTNSLLVQNLNVDNRDLYPGQVIRRSVRPIRSKFPFDSFSTVGYNDTVYLRTTLLQVNHDTRSSNDTASRVQEFANYYAYDDGTAEEGYGLDLGIYHVGRVAYRFHILKKDTLRGMMMFFNFSNENVSNRPFKIMVWKDYKKDPVYSAETNVPQFSDSLVNNFYIYRFDTTGFVIDTGNLYIGWEQQADYVMNVGLDRNYYMLHNDTSYNTPNPNIFYYWANKWNTSDAPGALMMRPIIGHDLPLSVEKPVPPESETAIIYPNPASEMITISNLREERYLFTMSDMNGKTVTTRIIGKDENINTSGLPDGIYIVRILSIKGKNVYYGKLLINH